MTPLMASDKDDDDDDNVDDDLDDDVDDDDWQWQITDGPQCGHHTQRRGCQDRGRVAY